MGVPILSYGSDVGLRLGAALFFYEQVLHRPDLQRTAILSASYTTSGPRAVDFTWDNPSVSNSPFGALFNLHLADDPRMPYWGEGAQLGGLSEPTGFGVPPEPYRYNDRRVFATGFVNGPIAAGFGWHFRARFLDVGVSNPSALLVDSAPPGSQGGQVLLGEVGVSFDSRDRMVNTQRGLYATLSTFMAPYISGLSDFAFHGYDASARIYLPLWSGGMLAVRGLYDLKLSGLAWDRHTSHAAVPFFERMLYEGIKYNEGLGSASTIRGIARFRISGDEKMMANVQLRTKLFATHWFEKEQEFGLTVGIDAGRASQPGYAAVTSEGVAVGLRMVWDQALIFRLETAKARDSGGDWGLYAAFGELF